MCPIPNGFISLYSSKIVDKKEMLRQKKVKLPLCLTITP
jgi:hypothetical protein